jgi:hypothetical protein
LTQNDNHLGQLNDPNAQSEQYYLTPWQPRSMHEQYLSAFDFRYNTYLLELQLSDQVGSLPQEEVLQGIANSVHDYLSQNPGVWYRPLPRRNPNPWDQPDQGSHPSQE